jgi:hypothetical protein
VAPAVALGILSHELIKCQSALNIGVTPMGWTGRGLKIDHVGRAKRGMRWHGTGLGSDLLWHNSSGLTFGCHRWQQNEAPVRLWTFEFELQIIDARG